MKKQALTTSAAKTPARTATYDANMAQKSKRVESVLSNRVAINATRGGKSAAASGR